jgi:hypothetical protein
MIFAEETVCVSHGRQESVRVSYADLWYVLVSHARQESARVRIYAEETLCASHAHQESVCAQKASVCVSHEDQGSIRVMIDAFALQESIRVMIDTFALAQGVKFVLP